MTDEARPLVFPPTLREVMLRPRWLGVLGLCLVIAAVFAWLGQWQLERAIDTDPPPPGMTEDVRPIADVTTPGAYLPEPLVGQRVDVTGSFVADDFIVVSNRFNAADAPGYWVTGQLRVADTEVPTALAVAIGWTADRAEADRIAASLDAGQPVDLTGRLVSDEGPGLPPKGAPATEQTRMSPAALLSLWHDAAGIDVYRPYLIVETPMGGLEAIRADPPEELSPVNWLNVFYAAEWAVFAGFAFYLWYRLAKDAWEKEVEIAEDGDDDPETAHA